MNAFRIETKIKPADQPLQDYQVDFTKAKFSPPNSINDTAFKSGKADDFEVICRDGSFGVHVYCLYNSDFLYKQYKARQNFEGEGKGLDKTGY